MALPHAGKGSQGVAPLRARGEGVDGRDIYIEDYGVAPLRARGEGVKWRGCQVGVGDEVKNMALSQTGKGKSGYGSPRAGAEGAKWVPGWHYPLNP
jgi:hypothetical protein